MSDDEGSVYRIPETFSDAAEADKAAQAKANQLKRGEGSVSVTVEGDTSIVAGAPLLFQGVRPGLDGVPFIIDTATHSYSKGEGYRTQISGKLYDGKSGKKKKGLSRGAGAEAGSADDGKVAPNSAAGTPETPKLWEHQRRNSGLTDAN